MKMFFKFRKAKVMVDKNINMVANGLVGIAVDVKTAVELENGEQISFDEMDAKGYKLVSLDDYNYHWKYAKDFPEFAAVVGMIKKEHIQRLLNIFK
jgi:hypothetical protein